MKQLYFLLALLLITVSFAQTPQGFNYQATVRDNSGELVVSENVYFKFNVIQGSQTSVPVYSETHYVSTDDLGQVGLVIGEGTATTGVFTEIDWSLGNYFLGIELDTGSGYVAMGTTQMRSVPYALYAESSGSATSATTNLETILEKNNSANNEQIKNLQDPEDEQDVVTKAYTYSKAEVNTLIKTLQNQINDSGTDSPADASYPEGTVHCDPDNPTKVVDVTNPETGKTWMDRNLGASQVAESSTDADAYGDLYQWGRGADGHQCRDSQTTTTLSSTGQPGHGDFILAPNSPEDWLETENNLLWNSGTEESPVKTLNDPCPSGYRVPTSAELNAETQSWSSQDSSGAMVSPLKFPVAGYRSGSNGTVRAGAGGGYWTSALSGTVAVSLTFDEFQAVGNGSGNRAIGRSVRCIKYNSGEDTPSVTVPEAPSITGVTAGDGEAEITFDAPTEDGGSTITTYTATSSPGDITSSISQAGGGTITVDGLTNGTPYTFTVTATNGVGTSDTSDTSDPVTPVVTLNIGDYHEGGVVFHIFQSGEDGYVEGETHGLISAISNLRNSNFRDAKYRCTNYSVTIDGTIYSDWFLPSKDELNFMYQNKATIDETATANGGSSFSNTFYWSSTIYPYNNAYAYGKHFNGANMYNAGRQYTHSVRAVRKF